MTLRRAPIALFLCTVACAEGEGDVARDGGIATFDGSTTRDAGTSAPRDDASLTLSPLECQADLEALHDEASEIRQHPVPYKGQLFVTRRVSTPDGDKSAAVSLLDGRILVQQEQDLPGGVTDDYAFIYGIGTQPVTAPDYGDQNDPDYPVALVGQLVANLERDNILLRLSPDRPPSLELRSGQPLPFGGSAKRFFDVRMGAGEELFFFLEREDDPLVHLARQSAPGGAIARLLSEGDALPSIDEADQRFVAELHGPLRPMPFGEVVVRVSLKDRQDRPTGFAYLAIHTFGAVQCLATDDFAVDCGGVLIDGSHELFEFGGDGATFGAVVGPNSDLTLHYKVVGAPRVEALPLNQPIQGFTFNDFARPRACPTNNSLYFIATFSSSTRSNYDELMRMDERGVLHRVTDFGALLDQDALKGEVPDEIRSYALGYECDAVMYTWGPSRADSNSGYEGYWAAYADGDVVEVIDETAGRADNGNGELMGVTRARSGIDPNADVEAMVTVAPDGAFDFISRVDDEGTQVYRYFRATRPKNRCREPVTVNSAGDASDAAPGDGRCDTGGVVGDDPECTLRAAIEETNARSGGDEIDVALTRGARVSLGVALPSIRSTLTLNGGGIVVDGANAGAEAIGFEVVAERVVLRDVAVDGFAGDGVRAEAPVVLEGVSSTNNGGWGLWLEQRASVAGGVATSSIARNGSGGIFSAASIEAGVGLRLSDVAIAFNGGPGVMATGQVVVAGEVVASDNAGAGVQLESVGGFVGTRLSQSFGTLTARRNRDHGIAAYGGDVVLARGVVRADANCRFGVYVDGGRARLGITPRSRDAAHSVRGNGVGSDGVTWSLGDDGAPISTPVQQCSGGGVGILGVGPDARGSPSVVVTATIADNRGPGVASTDRVRLIDVGIEGNLGAGVAFFDEQGDTSLDTTVVDVAAARIVANAGAGIAVDVGSVEVRDRALVRANRGAGIAVAEGHVRLNAPGRGETMVEGNGAGGECFEWRVDSEWVGASASCTVLDGVRAADGNITAVAPTIVDNGGAGLYAADPNAAGHGLVEVRGGRICGNASPDVAETFDYEMVDTSCR